MKTKDEVYASMSNRFGEDFANGSAIDAFMMAVAEADETIYEEIEASKNPYLYSKLTGDNLDDLGQFMDMPRGENESDSQYLYRLMNWKVSAEKGNEIAIQTALLNLSYSSYAKYVKQSNGCGTGTIYLIPVEYTDEIVENALKEAEERILNVVSPSQYIEYVVPEVRRVTIHVEMEVFEDGNESEIKTNLHESIRLIVNNIAPNGYLSIGEINKIGINEKYVSYFNVIQSFIDEKEYKDTKILQDIQSKFILDEIIWN